MGDRSSRSGLVLAATAVALGAMAGTAWFANRPSPTPAPGPAPAASSGAPDAPDVAALPAPPTPAPAAPAGAPAFDLVRVEPDGQAAVVGTAPPGAKVTVFADGTPVAEAEADAEGNFVALFSVAPSAVPQALTLGATTPGGTEAVSTDVVMLLPQAPGAAAAGPGAAAAPAIAATAVVRDEGVEILPPPGDPAAPRRVTLGSISYAAAGEVRLAGVGTAGAVIRIYVDDRFVREVRVAGDGRWQAGLDDVAQGLYRLRVDELGPTGAVASRVETPFQRDLPPPPRPRPAGPAEGATGGAVAPPQLTVQPGNNLWTLARSHYGSGVEYTRIYTANRDLIRNPDLIYPGQIFRMPEQAGGAAAGAPAGRPAEQPAE